MKYAYYPGCSLERNASAYNDSALAVAGVLGIELAEIDDWNCCGASEYMSVDLLPAYALVSRNLALAAQQPGSVQIVAPCSNCYLNLSKTDNTMQESPLLAEKINRALAAGGLHYQPGSLRVRHLLDIMVNDLDSEAIEQHIEKPLYDLRVAPYYGCLIVRPSLQGSFDDPEYPTSLDKLMDRLGAEVVDFPMKAHCCGGHMTQISESIALELIRQLLKSAADYEADVIVTLCPMCQLNLDAYQDAVNRQFRSNYNIPILYFTQLMGLAFGLSPDSLGFGKEFVDAGPALAKIAAAPPKKTRQSRPAKEALPMPARLEE